MTKVNSIFRSKSVSTRTHPEYMGERAGSTKYHPTHLMSLIGKHFWCENLCKDCNIFFVGNLHYQTNCNGGFIQNEKTSYVAEEEVHSSRHHTFFCEWRVLAVYNRSVLITWLAAMYSSWNKRKFIHSKRV